MSDNKIECQKKYFNNLDFLRVIFTFIIIMLHLPWFAKAPACLEPNKNYIAVEFFFMLSGFLLFFENGNLKNFMIKRYIRLAPVVLFQIFLIDFIISNQSTDLLLGALFLNISIKHNFYYSWFIPVLFWASVFYVFLKNSLPKKYIYSIISIIVYISYSYVLNNNNYSLDSHQDNILFILNLGMLRALGGVGVGFLLASLYSKIQPSNTRIKSLFFSFLEIFVLYLFFNCFFAKSINLHLTDINILFLLSFLILSFAFNLGLISKLLDKISWHILAKFCFSIYIMQYISFKIADTLFSYFSISEFIKSEYTKYYFTLCICILVGILTYYIIERPIYKFFLKKIYNQ